MSSADDREINNIERKNHMTFERVAKVLAEYRDMDVSEITMETSFEKLALDSLDMVDLVMMLEDEFDLEIEIKEKLETVQDLVELIESLQ
jgi:acyl carrier protein